MSEKLEPEHIPDDPQAAAMAEVRRLNEQQVAVAFGLDLRDFSPDLRFYKRQPDGSEELLHAIPLTGTVVPGTVAPQYKLTIDKVAPEEEE